MAHGSSQPMAQAAGYAPSDLLDDPGALCDPQSGARGPVAEHHRCAQQYNPDTTYGTGIYIYAYIDPQTTTPTDRHDMAIPWSVWSQGIHFYTCRTLSWFAKAVSRYHPRFVAKHDMIQRERERGASSNAVHVYLKWTDLPVYLSIYGS